MGRKRELDATLETTITNQIRIGNYRKHAAEMAGVTEQQMGLWMRLGQGGEGSEKLSPGDRARYESFADNVVMAESAAICTMMMHVSAAAASGDWRAASWFLARKARHEWADPAKAGVREQFELLLQVVDDVLGKKNAERILKEFISRSDQEAA